jgi:hypothetical protein
LTEQFTAGSPVKLEGAFHDEACVAVGGGAWGSVEYTGQPLGEAHKHRALVEWAKAQPATTGR